MSWFRRRTEPETPPVHLPNPAEAAAAFWRGWLDLLPEISAALGDGEPHRLENELCDLVAALHPDLHFSLERGHRAIYALVVSGQEDPRLRPYTDAWAAAAPPEDMIWEYHDSVPPVPDPTLVTVNLGPKAVRLADVRVVAQVTDGLVDVAVFHPLFADLDDTQRRTMTFLPLDVTLGERLAAERLGRVETASAAPEGTIGLLELRDLVHALADPPA
ncbi:hypothetical protein ABZ816_37560 [Actinosynnema sp. NPDC047251]|uniref:Uncharacterized protein n=1 Tax=Saccharothrix espanaensis (strain ATCC 51144 / DSM 44229 / JCM 9112 / NBRC 15066 / NRRL 15764) TaxID=1179773 RepID=K0KD17_SACES|nr:hypothetical protein [Saccharothrix espanaensis]CCH34463.1 hypothetical protein BN6_72290 [Saccharothrix espanaensis DSM 44229]